MAAVGFEGADLVQVPPWDDERCLEEIQIRGKFDLFGAGWWDVMGYWCQRRVTGTRGNGNLSLWGDEFPTLPRSLLQTSLCRQGRCRAGGEGSAELSEDVIPPEILLWETARLCWAQH